MAVSDEPRAGDRWRFKFPNTADFNFNYWKLLHDDGEGPIAYNKRGAEHRIAIVGAGVAGMTAARELYRAGYTNIDIYEATDRIGGRTYSESSPLPDGVTTYELGAMRLPFFWPHDTRSESGGPGSENCVLDFYCTTFGIATQPFPNPGGKGITTGIYVNRGRGANPRYEPDPTKVLPPDLILWKHAGDSPDDPGSALDAIYQKWAAFKQQFQQACRAAYSDDDRWAQLWSRITEVYQEISFRRFVRMPPGNSQRGEFGGLGMTPSEARILAVIGLGDGGWGAFYEVSCLWVLRTLLFGFGDNLQLIKGKLADDGTPLRWSGESPRDSLDQPLNKPAFLGVQSLVEFLFFGGPDGPEGSLYAATKKATWRDGVHLYTGNPVRSLTFRPNPEAPNVRIISDRIDRDYQAVVVTAPPGSLAVETPFQNFDPTRLPWVVRDAMNLSHFITSCKVFYPLKKRYWGNGSNIPQVISTDTFVQGVYGIAVEGEAERYPGVLLASYTWEDDATKLIADNDEELARRCLSHLDDLLERCQILDRFSNYVDERAKPRVVHWARSPWHRGCARLYRPGNWELDNALLAYNRDCSASSHLYLAGEAYSVEGGWVEPALRSALDAVIHIVKNSGGTFSKTFDFSSHYPQYKNIPTIVPSLAS